MNPQIKKIWEKAANNHSGDSWVDQTAFLENFAHLLIEECSKICFELQYSKEGPAEGAAYQRSLCGCAIKENFGLMSKGPITAKNIK